jgi:hypothetical protein
LYFYIIICTSSNRLAHQALSYDSAYEEKKLWALKAFERYHVKSIYAGADNMAVIAAVIL